MLKTANLSYKFDDKYIFSNLSFEFANDSVFKLVGDNGSGKSTLLKILSGILDYSNIQSAYLSEGQKRKINIVSFMLSTADLYLLDEPFNNLDRKTTDFLQEIFDMKINTGAKIIFSSHDRSNDDFPFIDMNLFN